MKGVTTTKNIQIPQTASNLKSEYERNVDLVMPGRWGGTVAEGTVGIVPAGRADWSCFAALLGSWNLSTEDDITVFEGEYLCHRRRK